MGILGGAFRSVMNPMNLAMLTTPAGWSMLATQTALRSFGNQLLTFAANELGVSPQILNAALSAYDGRAGFNLSSIDGVRDAGNFLQALQRGGASPIEIARAQRDFNEAVRDAKSEVKDFLQEQLGQMNRSNERRKMERDMKSVLNGKGSILMKLAMIMGMVADQKLGSMMDKAKQIGAMGEIKGSNQAKFTQRNAELQALGQEFNIVSQAMTNIIKTVGDAQAVIARKG